MHVFTPTSGTDTTKSTITHTATPTMSSLDTWLRDDRLTLAALGAVIRAWYSGNPVSVPADVEAELRSLDLVDVSGDLITRDVTAKYRLVYPPGQRRPTLEEKAVAAGSLVYYLRRSDGAVKIGMSKRLEQRTDALGKIFGPLTLLATEPGARMVETRRHRQFDAYRITDAPPWHGTEWFRAGRRLMAHVKTLAGVL